MVEPFRVDKQIVPEIRQPNPSPRKSPMDE